MNAVVCIKSCIQDRESKANCLLQGLNPGKAIAKIKQSVAMGQAV